MFKPGSMQKILCHMFKRNHDECHGPFIPFTVLEPIRRMSFTLQKPKIEDINVPDVQHTDKLFSSDLETFLWLHNIAPGFPVGGNKVSVIDVPSHFYETLLTKCQSAKKRITLASLYLGTGRLEEKLVSAIHQNLNQAGGRLKVKVLIDYMRGSRGKLNSRRMLLPLLKHHHESCQVSLYHTPALRGPLRSLLPARYNELIGLQHMKLYLFDNSLLISGANLSNDYFTNRQDRYLLIEDCEPLADFFDGLVSRVSEFSLQLNAQDQVQLHSSWSLYPFKGRQAEFVSAARKHVWDHYSAAVKQQQQALTSSSADTWIFPLIEMGQLGIHHDSQVTTQLLSSAHPGSLIHLATGYFNLTQEYMNTIIHRSAACYRILMAHPTANGFLGAKGPAGGIPAAYTELAAKFLKQLQAEDHSCRVQMFEYQKPGWTYHAKGLWYTLPGKKLPSLSLVGSPNFGCRSVHRDLETQVAVVTNNKKLQHAWLQEQQRLFGLGSPFTEVTCAAPERTVPLWVHLIVWLCRNYF
ncbi:CDP-diacylglycerol--glycerol-3-phosphate 3-phosphatidyltransferase, mitochondrial isoform X2 [Anabrus simplex]|uniref:CDP-diacylglycerol--glycerol-3-phosphate 3-phosphatidyltransferase, mitochondrial isoform X2 n=1 Tax=Anabrus simplex TaxID=316456 RepID=UPI0035A30809